MDEDLWCAMVRERTGEGGTPAEIVRLRAGRRCNCGCSDMVSSVGRGLRACATARGPISLGRKGAATEARMMLPKTVVGSTFSLIFSTSNASYVPKTILCTLLNMRLQVLK